MIKLYLNKLQWIWLSDQLKSIVAMAPVKDLELESLFLAEMYRRKINELTFYKPGGMGMRMTLTQTEGYAINNYFAGFNNFYDTFLRMLIEPKLMSGK